MPTVRELTALYEELLVGPRHGAGVCATCLTFTDGYERCFVCAQQPNWLDAVAPVSLSIAHGQLHHTLASYKRLGGEVGRRLTVELAALLWRYLDGHEQCVANAAGAARFDLVTTVPARRASPDGRHPLQDIVSAICRPTRDRYLPVLEHAGDHTGEHRFDAERYTTIHNLTGRAVLLIDDTWTTGASAQSAAAALRRAGARRVAAVVLGRHLKRDWRDNDARLRAMHAPFSWEACVCCATALDLPTTVRDSA